MTRLGESGLFSAYAGQTLWQRPHSVHASRSSSCFHVSSSGERTPRTGGGFSRSIGGNTPCAGPSSPKKMLSGPVIMCCIFVNGMLARNCATTRRGRSTARHAPPRGRPRLHPSRRTRWRMRCRPRPRRPFVVRRGDAQAFDQETAEHDRADGADDPNVAGLRLLESRHAHGKPAPCGDHHAHKNEQTEQIDGEALEIQIEIAAHDVPVEIEIQEHDRRRREQHREAREDQGVHDAGNRRRISEPCSTPIDIMREKRSPKRSVRITGRPIFQT